jgi:tryptophanyl-tRNA synthetase
MEMQEETMAATESAPRAAGATRRRVFSGMQPSGEKHLGNYIGAIKPWVETQAEKENFFCIVDLHSLTVPQEPADLHRRTRALAAIFLASGIDPEQSTLFIQSHVTAHAECCWLFNCVTPVGWLEKMTQYKDKSAKQESVLTALLDYPVLQAADILLYDAHEVPVGEDQKQHIELARNIAGRFNHLYGDTFVLPEPRIPKVGARIMGLDDPTTKMSTSIDVRGHAIRVLDDPKEIEWAFKRAKTDSGNEIRFSDDPEKAGVNNLLSIYEVISGLSREAIEAEFATARGYGDLKMRVAEAVIETFRPIRERYERLMQDPAELDNLLARGADQARAVAMPKLALVKEKMGLVLGR